ncbi:EamA family transporter [Photobacterium kishitanii]|uniref:EamA family transporter n=1 Tax=Photobacterium kishitanii TaxID=318456 RepID=A0A2T3KK71_9GAMM|nr:EamA family transporter [Photobacterium kishitanii]PSU99975.1 EamA family transporter [Photobacterium kishitanii]PSV09325.1 EamA family transporter [Photobacterium kishitanii]
MFKVNDLKSTKPKLLWLVLPVVLIWGCNFAVMRVGVNDVGPFTLAAMRFFIAAVPLIFFVRRPKIPFWFIALYSLTFGFGQFSFLFSAINLGLPSGMASLLVQLQAVFTPILGFFVLRQRITLNTLFAIIISLSGLVVILFATVQSANIMPIVLGTLAALSWGASNVVIAWGTSRNYDYNPVALVIWASALLPVPFMFAAISSNELQGVGVMDIVNVLPSAIYLGLIATIIAYHLWVKAISLYNPTNVSPFSLLIPVIGLFLGSFIFDEVLNTTEIVGCILVIGGVIVHIINVRRSSSVKKAQMNH